MLGGRGWVAEPGASGEIFTAGKELKRLIERLSVDFPCWIVAERLAVEFLCGKGGGWLSDWYRSLRAVREVGS